MRKSFVVSGFLVSFLAGCGPADSKEMPKLDAKTEKIYRDGWRDSWYTGCTIRNEPDYCECVIDKAMKKLSTRELYDAPKAWKFIEEKIAPACKPRN